MSDNLGFEFFKLYLIGAGCCLFVVGAVFGSLGAVFVDLVLR